MRVLVGCEYSGVVRDAFRKRGHDAWSCDLLPTEGNPKYHIQDDIFLWINKGWDLAIFHPPCTYLSSSGLHWNKRVLGRAEKTKEALQFVQALLDAPIPRIALENPVGCISTKIRPADQYIQPWEFGHDASKKTGLWLKGLPKLIPTSIIIKDRYANQTPSGQNKLGPGPDRAKERSRTYEGIGEAMASQWGI